MLFDGKPVFRDVLEGVLMDLFMNLLLAFSIVLWIDALCDQLFLAESKLFLACKREISGYIPKLKLARLPFVGR